MCLLQAQFNYVSQATFNNNYNCLPLCKGSSVLETKALGRRLRRLMKDHLVVSVFVPSADVYHVPAVGQASVKSYRR